MEAFYARPLKCFPVRAVTRDGTLCAKVGGGGDGDGEDRISALPDDLRRNIVSRLPIKDAFRTTALSTCWRRLWHSTPLVLYDAHLNPDEAAARLAVIDRVLAGHPGPFQTVHLAVCYFDKHERELALWPRLLAAAGVRDLAMVSLPGPMKLPRLPADILRCKELQRLYLGFFVFPDTAVLPAGANVFPDLRELAVVNCYIEKLNLDRMLASSPVLETLALFGSFGFENEHVRLIGQKLQCVLFWQSMAAEVTAVDAPIMERLILWDSPARGEGALMGVKIAKDVPELKVLGVLEPRIHELQIGNTIIKADTKVSPRSMVPSVKILALKLNLGVFKEVQMLVSFLRCFPNIETLHVESAIDGEPSGNDYMDFYKELSPIECVQSRIKLVVLHEIHGDLSELMFLKFISQRAGKLHKLTSVLSGVGRATVGQMKHALETLALPPWASETCTVLLAGPREDPDLNFHQACDLSVHDPFLEYGQEFFRFIKTGE